MTRPAGWYRDDDAGALRYWNGKSWADEAPAAAEAPPAKKSAQELLVLIGLGAVIVVLIGAIVAAVILAMRMDFGAPTVTAQTTNSDAPAPSATPETTAIEPSAIADTGPKEPQAAVGEEVRDGNFSFVVTGVQRVDAVSDPEHPEIEKAAQGEFVLVEMTVTNVGGEPQPFFVSFHTLSDGSTLYKSDDEAWLYLGNRLADLNPGDSLETAVVFDVPEGTEAKSIELHDVPFSAGVSVAL